MLIPRALPLGLLLAGMAVLGLAFIQFIAPGTIAVWIRDAVPPIPAPPFIPG